MRVPYRPPGQLTEATGTPLAQRKPTRTSVSTAWNTRPTEGPGPRWTPVAVTPGNGSHDTRVAVGPVQRAVTVPPAVVTVRSTGAGPPPPPPPPPPVRPGPGPPVVVRARAGSRTAAPARVGTGRPVGPGPVGEC